MEVHTVGCVGRLRKESEVLMLWDVLGAEHSVSAWFCLW